VNDTNNHQKLVTLMILAAAVIAGLSATTSYQLSYASLLEADDSECSIFCPRIEDSIFMIIIMIIILISIMNVVIYSRESKRGWGHCIASSIW
jgi:hypothetical protein